MSRIPNFTDELHTGNGRLSDRHREDLRKSGLTDATIKSCEFHTVSRTEVQSILRWNNSAGILGESLAIPYRDLDGSVNGYRRLKPDNPRTKNGKTIKYEAPVGLPNRAYFPPGTVGVLNDASVPILITEGEKKSARADQDGFHCIGLSGVWNRQKKRSRDERGKGVGPRELIDDLAAIGWNNRDVYIAFDHDPSERTTHNVQFAAWCLAEVLAERGANVRWVMLPPGPPDGNGIAGKMGLDDFLVNHTPDDLRKLIADAQVPQKPGRQSDLPQIVCNGRQLREVSADVVNAIEVANNPPTLFQRGDLLTRVRIKKETGAPTLQVMVQASLRGHASRVADFLKATPKGEIVAAFPPQDVIGDILSLPMWNIPVLRSVIEAPVYSSAGTLVLTPGYHPDVALWYHPAKGLNVPPVSSKPSADDISRAKALLLVELYGDFPFKDDASRAHALAALLAPFVRELIDGPVPLHLFDAPVEGTGKTLLTTVISIVATGRSIEASAEVTNDEEMRKRITAILSEGPTYVLIDNLSRTLDSGAFASVLTTRIWKDRILGVSKTGAFPNTAVWLASGNNARLSRELIRRTVWTRIDSNTDAPWERTGFRHPNLIRWTTENRGQLVWAALTLCQAWIAAGRPAGKQTLGMFESWAETIGGIFDVVGIPGLLANAKDFRVVATDKSHEWREFVTTWWAEFQDKSVGIASLFELVQREKLLDSVLSKATDTGNNEKSQRTRLGIAMVKQRDRIYGEYRIGAGQQDHKGRQTYQLIRTPIATAPKTVAAVPEAGSGEVDEWTA